MRPSFSSSSLASCGRSSFDSSASSSFDQPSTDSAFHHSRNSLFKPVRALAANDERMRLLPSPKTIPPTRCSTSPKLAPACLSHRTSSNSQACPEEHPEMGLSSQPIFAQFASKQACTSLRRHSTSGVSIVLSEHLVAHFNPDHSARSEASSVSLKEPMSRALRDSRLQP